MSLIRLFPLVALLLGLLLVSGAQAKPRRDSGCHDRCDRALLDCPAGAAACDRDRRDCLRSCDADPSRPSALTRQRLNESDAQLHQRLSAKPAGKLSICQVNCEDALEACAQVNGAQVCAEGRQACFQRCKARSKR